MGYTSGSSGSPTIQQIEKLFDKKLAGVEDVLDMSDILEDLMELDCKTLNEIAKVEGFLIALHKETLILKGKLLELEKTLSPDEESLRKEILKIVQELPWGLGQTTKVFVESAKLIDKHTKIRDYLNIKSFDEYYERNIKKLESNFDVKLLI